MKIKKEYLFIIAILSVLGYCIYLHISRPKIAYVELPKLYDGFNLKKEKENELKLTETQHTHFLDSLKLKLELTKRAYESGNKSDTLVMNYQMGVKNYQMQTEQFERVKSGMIEKFDAEIWQQLNQYITDYSKDKSYDFVMGTNGTGSLMYSNNQYDITDQLITYANERYSGK